MGRRRRRPRRRSRRRSGRRAGPARWGTTCALVSHTDTAGAVLLVVGCLGAAAWAWTLARSQFDIGDQSPFFLGGGESLTHRLDVITTQVAVLLFAGLLGGLGVALRAVAWARTEDGLATTSPFGRPFGRLLAGAAAALALLLVAAALLEGDDDGDGLDFDRSIDEVVGDDVVIEGEFGDDIEVPTSESPAAPTHTLEVHTDGCGVIRSGEIGDDLTWVVKDQDGFQVLGRNAAGETQYRYFRPGAYTVVLEGWNGRYYAEVSNEVDIIC